MRTTLANVTVDPSMVMVDPPVENVDQALASEAVLVDILFPPRTTSWNIASSLLVGTALCTYCILSKD